MSLHRDEHLDLLAARVAGCLDEADRFELEAHLASGCSVCQAELARLEEAGLLLAAAAGPRVPSRALRGRVLDRVRAEARAGSRPEPRRLEIAPRPVRPARSFAAWGWAAAAAVLAVVTFVTWDAGERLKSRVAATLSQLSELRRTLDDERRWNELLNSRETRVVSLAPTGKDSTGFHGRILYDPLTRRAVVVLDHATAGPGADYQLWAIRGTGPASLGLVRADASGLAVMRIEDAGNAAGLQAFGVSREPQGGSPTPNAPSGPVVLLGKVES